MTKRRQCEQCRYFVTADMDGGCKLGECGVFQALLALGQTGTGIATQLAYRDAGNLQLCRIDPDGFVWSDDRCDGWQAV